MKKFALAAIAAITLGVAGISASAPASAHGWGGHHHHGWHHGWRPHKISCRKGRRIVRRRGFRGIRPMKCFGRSYVYRAWKWGHPYRVRVHARRGFIMNVRPL